MQILRQSTAIDVRLGCFVDSVDGVTPETGITLGAADQAEALKADGAATATLSGTFAAVTGADGWYDYTLSTADTDTVGTLELVVQDADVCLPVFAKFQVVEEAVYDIMFASGATFELTADMVKISGSIPAADNLEASALGIVKGTATGGSATTVTATDITEATADHFIGRTIVFTSGTLSGQASNITDYAFATGTATFTVPTLTATPTSEKFVIV